MIPTPLFPYKKTNGNKESMVSFHTPYDSRFSVGSSTGDYGYFFLNYKPPNFAVNHFRRGTVDNIKDLQRPLKPPSSQPFCCKLQ